MLKKPRIRKDNKMRPSADEGFLRSQRLQLDFGICTVKKHLLTAYSCSFFLLVFKAFNMYKIPTVPQCGANEKRINKFY